MGLYSHSSGSLQAGQWRKLGSGTEKRPFPSFPHHDAVIGSSRFYLLTFEGKKKGRKSHRSCAMGIITVGTHLMSRDCRGRSNVKRGEDTGLVQGCRDGLQGGVDVPVGG